MISLRHFFRGSALAALDQLVRAAAALIVTPVMVTRLGVEDFGLWVLLVGVFSQFILLDPGLQTSLPRFLVEPDERRLRAVASAAHHLYLRVAAGSAVLSGIVWWLVPHLVKTTDRADAARLVVLLLGASNVVGLVLKLPSLHLQSQLRRDVIAGVSVVRTLVCSALVISLLQNGGGLRAVAVINAGGAAAEACALAWFGRDVLALVRREWIERDMLRTLVGYSKWAYVIANCERLRVGLDGFVLGWLRGSAAAGTYSLGARPISMAFDTVYAFIGTQLLPAFARLRHLDEHARLGSVFVIVTRLSAWLSLATAGLIIVLGPPFLEWWVPSQAAAAKPVLLCLALPFALQVAQVPAVHLLYALAEHRALAVVQSAGLLLNLALSLWLAHLFGIIGAALGTAVEILLLHGWVMPLLIARKAHIHTGDFLLRAQFIPLLGCALVFVPLWLATKYFLPATPALFHLVCAGSSCVALLAAAARVFKIGRTDLADLRELLR